MNYDSIIMHPNVYSALPNITNDLSGGITASMFGMKVHVTPSAKAPARKHKRRAWMSENYHRRIQKKWNKRFGFVDAVYMFDSSFLRTGDMRFAAMWKEQA